MIPLTFLLALAGCKDRSPSPDTEPVVDSERPSDDSAAPEECRSDEFEDAEGHCVSREIAGVWSDGVVQVQREEFSYAWSGWDVGEFILDNDHHLGLRDLFGGDPRFYVIGPRYPDPNQPYTVLVSLYGGAADVDTEVPEGLLETCTAERSESLVRGAVQSRALFQIAVERGWMVVVPENPSCDGWLGLGAEDPADAGHAGFALAQAALDYLDQGRADVQVERVMVAGQSLGSIGAVWFATHRQVEGLVVDSGPMDLVRYTLEESYSPEDLGRRQDIWFHILGGAPEDTDGAPTDWAERFTLASLTLSARESRLQGARVVHLWSEEDALSGPAQHNEVSGTLQLQGVPYLEYNAAHTVPTHVQSGPLSSVYASMGAISFLDGEEVVLLELEDGVTAEVPVSVEDRGWASQGALLRAEAGQPGLVVSRPVGLVEAGQQLSLTAFVKVPADAEAEPGVAFSLRIRDSQGTLAEQPLTVTQAQRFSELTYDRMRPALDTATLSVEGRGETLWLDVVSTGRAPIEADVVVARFRR
ncbi:MAG: hypothetical protein H6741_14850 [Alphaproteobacteria bacterium]|nr:hypothetical protein [Alphaproteobacteria bacterium]